MMIISVKYLGLLFVFSVLLFIPVLDKIHGEYASSSSDVPDQTSISEKRTHEVSENTFAYQFDFCATEYNEGAIGIMASSDTEKIPVPIDPNIQMSQCHQYGTLIYAFSDSSLKASLFYEKDVPKLFKSFEKKKMNLEDDLVVYQQKLLRLQNPSLDENNSEEIDRVKSRIDLINYVIQSYKQSLNVFRAM